MSFGRHLSGLKLKSAPAPPPPPTSSPPMSFPMSATVETLSCQTAFRRDSSSNGWHRLERQGGGSGEVDGLLLLSLRSAPGAGAGAGPGARPGAGTNCAGAAMGPTRREEEEEQDDDGGEEMLWMASVRE